MHFTVHLVALQRSTLYHTAENIQTTMGPTNHTLHLVFGKKHVYLNLFASNNKHLTI